MPGTEVLPILAFQRTYREGQGHAVTVATHFKSAVLTGPRNCTAFHLVSD
jgi:hypothetical protein